MEMSNTLHSIYGFEQAAFDQLEEKKIFETISIFSLIDRSIVMIGHKSGINEVNPFIEIKNLIFSLLKSK